MTRKKALTIIQAARHLKISKPAVIKAIRTGRLKATYGVITKRVRVIPAAAIDAFIVSRSHQERGKKS